MNVRDRYLIWTKVLKLRLTFSVTFFKRYVNDKFTSIPNNKHSESSSQELNNSLAFEDTKIIRKGNQILKINWHHKERFINYFSLHSFQHKINVIGNLKRGHLQFPIQTFVIKTPN